jgi:hypothetical protein
MSDMYVVQIWQDGMMVAQVASISPAAALDEAARYARIYGPDGPVRIKVRNPKVKP